eukprot:TRINITY_DN34331_c0_g1_i1.p1 TRINITY_DN34331_c0_g1~~TRINITY_DN34331_c0_g1_i1.p1  ORF type:complete len:278 (+),score=15.77 TRINITY_DN34331_c0_g1_i1:84-917(+)
MTISRPKTIPLNDGSKPFVPALWDWAVPTVYLCLTYFFHKLDVHERAIIENDPALSYERIHSQVPYFMVWVVVVLIGVIISGLDAHFSPSPYKLQAFQRTFFGFAMSVALSDFFGSFLKQTVGRPRPSFFEECEWNSGQHQCGDEHEEQNARRSFPSGHTSLAFAGMVFAAGWILIRLKSPSFEKLRCRLSFLPMALVLLATWVGATRTQDNRHNPSDVLGGMLLGICGAAFSLWYTDQQNILFEEEVDSPPLLGSQQSTPERSMSAPVPMPTEDNV